MRYFITAIDTNIGKTVVSAILCKALNYSYWKPVQCGDLDHSDTMKVKNWVEDLVIHKEAYQLKDPLSPHEAARLSGIEIKLENINVPEDKNLIIEGAGGIMVPLNYNGDLVIDIAIKTGAETILVMKNYLGSINHTLLSVEYLKTNNIPIKGIILIGDTTESSENIIEKITGCKILYRFDYSDQLNEDFIFTQAQRVKQSWSELT